MDNANTNQVRNYQEDSLTRKRITFEVCDTWGNQELCDEEAEVIVYTGPVEYYLQGEKDKCHQPERINRKPQTDKRGGDIQNANRTAAHRSAQMLDSIVFVHGLTGSREDTWTSDSGIFWPQVYLQEDLPSVRILAFGYDADVVRKSGYTSFETLRGHGQALANDIAIFRENDGTDRCPIVFVAHSLGGLVCKQAVLICHTAPGAAMTKLANSVQGLMFFGTPHCGSNKAAWADVLARMMNLIKRTPFAVLKSLEPNSETLANLQLDFHNLLEQRKKQKRDIKIFCLNEELPSAHIGKIVEDMSSILPGYPHRSVHADHISMTKFGNRQDPGYLTAYRQLQSWVSDARLARDTPYADPPHEAKQDSFISDILGDRNKSHLGDINARRANVEDVEEAPPRRLYRSVITGNDNKSHQGNISMESGNFTFEL
ncbi:MAG: hypothetical protein M1821_006827 [Bathelium mastoideum]|nr:MAG: hypothetical protein M1821_006827 [Bathelium mastoideum]